MADLRVKYMGIELKNPIIVGACNLVRDLKNIKEIEAAGAAAIVYKSLFEEQIQLEALDLENDMTAYDERSAEMTSIFPHLEHAGAKEHLYNLKKVKEAISIPVIASLNAVRSESWIEYAKQTAETGVDGLELNFYALPQDFTKDAQTIENEQIAIVKAVREVVKIPISVKLSSFYTNILKLVSDMDKAGANGFVLFNRLFEPEINIDTEQHEFSWNLSNKGDNRLCSRFAGLLSGNISADICTNSGVFSGKDAIELLLAGSDAVQVVSTLYKYKIDSLTEIISEINQWMDDKKYKTVGEFKGKLAKKNLKEPYAYQRAQYVDILFNSEDIFKKFPMV